MNNPLPYRDPSGHAPCEYCGGESFDPTHKTYSDRVPDFVLRDRIEAGLDDLTLVAMGFVHPLAPLATKLVTGIGGPVNGVDAVFAAIPFVRGAGAVREGVEIVGAADEAGAGVKALSQADEFGIQPYNQIRNAIQEAAGTVKLQAHHLIEKRFAGALGLKAGEIPSVALTPEEHQVFTNLWRQAIGYNGSNALKVTGNAGLMDVWNAARDVYAQHPDLLRAVEQALFKR